MTEPLIVCVLGMHRSGTSLVTRVINLLGIDLGPEEHLLKPGAANPRGFWEYEPFVELNEKILATLGGSWQAPPTFPAGWTGAPCLETLRRRAQALIQKEFAAAENWAWKDPRACLTLPFWQELLPAMRYVLCLREPLDVAHSLKRRDGLSLAEGTYLWLLYTRSALEHTLGQPRCLISYEDFLQDWQSGLQRLAQFLGKPEQAAQTSVQEAVRDFIDRDLQHHRSSRLDLPGEGPTARWVEGLHLAERAWRRLSEESCPPLDLHPLLAQALDLVEPEVREKQREAYRRWQEQVQTTAEEIEALVPEGELFILVDGEQLGVGATLAGRRRLPFLERDGQYWGPPPDDATAIRELERMRQAGVGWMAFAWTAWWWLNYYTGLRQHLCSRFRCTLENERLVVFDLRS